MSQSSIPQTGRQAARSADITDKAVPRETIAPRGPLQTAHGATTIEDGVVAKIAGMAARDVPGVYDMGGSARRAFSAMADRIPNSQTNVAAGVSVETGDAETAVDVTIVVDYGASIVEVSSAIRRNVIQQVESATGLKVVEVNVHVSDVHLPGEDVPVVDPAEAPGLS